jgi:hypothetical protein
MTALQERQADAAVLNSQEFFRLFQTLESGGDIYEINTSAKAICVGPQSDLSNYAVNFFDAQSPDSIDEMNLSINNPIIGRVDALLDTQYPTAEGLPGLILVTSRDLVNNTFVPSTFAADPGNLVVARPLPQIDIISYLSPPPSLAPLRDDRLYSFPFVAGLTSPATAFYILPYYGRRYAEFSFQNLFGGAMSYTIDILGINLFPGTQDPSGVSPGSPKAVETVLAGGSIVVPAGLTSNKLIKSDTDGMFDLLSIAITTDSGLADPSSVMQVLVSDRIS